MTGRLRLDSDGIGAILDSPEVLAIARGLAESIANTARQSTGAEVVVDQYTAKGGRLRSSRGAMSITIKNRRARLWEARDGVLTRAAAATGLPVVSK